MSTKAMNEGLILQYGMCSFLFLWKPTMEPPSSPPLPNQHPPQKKTQQQPCTEDRRTKQKPTLKVLIHLRDSLGRPRTVLCQTMGKLVTLQKFCVTATVSSRFTTTCHQPPGTNTVSPGFCRISSWGATQNKHVTSLWPWRTCDNLSLSHSPTNLTPPTSLWPWRTCDNLSLSHSHSPTNLTPPTSFWPWRTCDNLSLSLTHPPTWHHPRLSGPEEPVTISLSLSLTHQPDTTHVFLALKNLWQSLSLSHSPTNLTPPTSFWPWRTCDNLSLSHSPTHQPDTTNPFSLSLSLTHKLYVLVVNVEYLCVKDAADFDVVAASKAAPAAEGLWGAQLFPGWPF